MAATSGGHLAVLQWLHAQGCPWGEGTCCEAAKGGDLELLQWARAHGCPWALQLCELVGTADVKAWIRGLVA